MQQQQQRKGRKDRGLQVSIRFDADHHAEALLSSQGELELESPQQISAAPDCVWQSHDADRSHADSSFEFAPTAPRDLQGGNITADQIFSGGKIRPVYPVTAAASSSATTTAALPEESEGERTALLPPRERELEGIPSDSFCVWKPTSASANSKKNRKKGRGGVDNLPRWLSLRSQIVSSGGRGGKNKGSEVQVLPKHDSGEGRKDKWRYM